MRPPALRPNAATPCSRPPSRRCAGSDSAPGASARSPPPPSSCCTISTTAPHDHRPAPAVTRNGSVTAPIAVHPNGTPLHQVGIVAALPQLLGVLFDRTRDLTGMSPARWCLGAGSCASWTTYGWPLGQPTVRLSAGFGLVCAVAICAPLRPPAPSCGRDGRHPAAARQ